MIGMGSQLHSYIPSYHGSIKIADGTFTQVTREGLAQSREAKSDRL